MLFIYVTNKKKIYHNDTYLFNTILKWPLLMLIGKIVFVVTIFSFSYTYFKKS